MSSDFFRTLTTCAAAAFVSTMLIAAATSMPMMA